jgi:glucokinase
VEHVISGRGFFNIHPVAHRDAPCLAGVDLGDLEAPAVISAAAMERRCPGCVETLDMFVEAYGAESGNLALRTVSSGGCSSAAASRRRFCRRSPTDVHERVPRQATARRVVAAMPVKVILNAEAGLLGAAVFAADEHNLLHALFCAAT